MDDILEEIKGSDYDNYVENEYDYTSCAPANDKDSSGTRPTVILLPAQGCIPCISSQKYAGHGGTKYVKRFSALFSK